MRNGDLKMIDEGANINQAGEQGQTPLYIAGRDGHLEVANALLVKSTSVDQANVTVITPLDALS
ncbi:hypothetical protein [Candidatus Synchoanobacter obligatus]|uniref:Ankyrin repeat protein n=1 Tax=Candidatus Synchoanobacter obligatus TaxID=2919597 RepID=A0ABT1L3J3_9GAMM|nr:hypothetical protein [Candidatus Synchoanobacter obligatus]MCP8351791.1 hypothetical protein [Candidatus Synchoanobacter obligatus]